MTMDDVMIWIKGASAVIVAFLNYIFGGWDTWLMTLVIFTGLDVLSGVLKAIVQKKVDSNKVIIGGVKKISIYVVVAVAVLLDGVILSDGQTAFRTLAIGYYIASEGLSILENAAIIGIPFPQKLKDILEQLRDKGETK